MPDRFENLIESRLKAELDPIVNTALAPRAGTFAWIASGRKPELSTTRRLTLAAAAGLALGGGVMAATAFTGSASPTVWTRQVQAVVSQCRVVFDPGERGGREVQRDRPVLLGRRDEHPAAGREPHAALMGAGGVQHMGGGERGGG